MAKDDFWIKFYIDDWLNDPELRGLRRENRDSWLTACLMMRKRGSYFLEGEPSVLANMLHLTVIEFENFLDDLQRTHAGNVKKSQLKVKIVSRRYRKEVNLKEYNRLAKQAQRDAEKSMNGQDDVKAMSGESQTTELEVRSYELKAMSHKLENSHACAPLARSKKKSNEEFLEDLKTDPTYTHVNIDRELGKAENWCSTHNRQCTQRFFVGWINRIDPPLNGNGHADEKLPSIDEIDARRKANMTLKPVPKTA